MIITSIVLLAQLTQPQSLIQTLDGAIRSQDGKFIPKVNHGLVDEKGTYYIETPSGYINTQNGQFNHKVKGGEKWERLYK